MVNWDGFFLFMQSGSSLFEKDEEGWGVVMVLEDYELCCG